MGASAILFTYGAFLRIDAGKYSRDRQQLHIHLKTEKRVGARVTCLTFAWLIPCPEWVASKYILPDTLCIVKWKTITSLHENVTR